MTESERFVGSLLTAERCVLLVVDKQRWYLDATVSPFLRPSDDALLRAEVAAHDELVVRARDAGVPVLWTMMTEGGDGAPQNVLARWERRPDEPRLRRSDPGFEFAGLPPVPDEAVFDKVYPDAFSVAALDRHLTGLRRGTMVLIGGYAARCVLATAFGAQRHGYHVVVPKGLAEPHPRHVEEEAVSLAVIDSIIGYVVDPEAVGRAWRRTGVARRADG